MAATTSHTVHRVDDTGTNTVRDELVVEAPLELRLGGVPIAVVMRTPGDDPDLGLGFALTEGIVLHPDEVAMVEPLPDPEGNRWELVLSPGVRVDPERFRRNLYTSSSCGVCGKASIDAVRVTSPVPPDGPQLEPGLLLSLPDRMRAAQPGFERTGGLHAAAAFDAGGEMLALAEDIGRHNAVDKLVGRLSRARWPIGEVVLLVSGRIGFEIVQKAAVAGLPVVAGISAASSLAAELGAELGLTVIGFVRPGGFVVYSHPDRLAAPHLASG